MTLGPLDISENDWIRMGIKVRSAGRAARNSCWVFKKKSRRLPRTIVNGRLMALQALLVFSVSLFSSLSSTAAFLTKSRKVVFINRRSGSNRIIPLCKSEGMPGW